MKTRCKTQLKPFLRDLTTDAPRIHDRVLHIRVVDQRGRLFVVLHYRTTEWETMCKVPAVRAYGVSLQEQLESAERIIHRAKKTALSAPEPVWVVEHD